MESKTSVIDVLERVLDELKSRVEGISREFREADLVELVGIAREFEEIMNDFRALVEKDYQYFNINTSMWYNRHENKVYCDIRVKGHALEFKVEDIDPNTPVSKILDMVLNNEKNLYYAAARAFSTLSTIGFRLKRLADLRESIDKTFEMIDGLKKVLEEIRHRCVE